MLLHSDITGLTGVSERVLESLSNVANRDDVVITLAVAKHGMCWEFAALVWHFVLGKQRITRQGIGKKVREM
jgi:hypothetical protein